MDPLLFLAHRIPFPPNKGDKIRSFHLLKHLSRRFRIYLGSFVDDPDDWRHREELRAYCESLCLRPLNPARARVRSLTGLFTGQPLTLGYFRDGAMTAWVREVLDRGIDRVLVFSAAMAQYVPLDSASRRTTVVDFVDVDSDKWRQYADRHRPPMNQIYRREARTLLAYERQLATAADAAVFVSDDEAALFRRLAPEAAARVHAVDNGVDTEYFSPERPYPNPYPAGSINLAFTGAMDYWANVEAVSWFAAEVFPLVRRNWPDARFVIAGARPTSGVLQLAMRAGVVVTGAVSDIRPYIAHADVIVAPLRTARGVQNKVLEALAMARPVVVTPRALEGLRSDPEMQWLVGEEPAQLAALCMRVLKGSYQNDAGRKFVCRNYSWSNSIDRLIRLLEDGWRPGLTKGTAEARSKRHE